VAQGAEVLVIGAGGLAGFLDSIAGGGGLINLPALALVLGPGPLALGTNKIPGTLGAFIALLVYAQNQKMDWPRTIAFSVWASVAAIVGSQLAPLVPASSFRWLLGITCPFILWMTWKKELWAAAHDRSPLDMEKGSWTTLIEWRIVCAAILSGLYDGIWGPGGGTLMLLALLLVVRLPLLPALAASKFANTCSGLFSVIGFSFGGQLNWRIGAWSSLGLCAGAFVGAQCATRISVKLIRPLLIVVSGLLLTKLAFL
jgi:uncharacterized membrane protein YfcA